MKRSLLLIALLLLSNSVFSQDFLGVPFGISRDSVSELMREQNIELDGGLSYRGIIHYCDVFLSFIYEDDKLVSIYLSSDDARGLNTLLNFEYGYLNHDDSSSRTTWDVEGGLIDYFVNKDSKSGYIFIRSKESLGMTGRGFPKKDKSSNSFLNVSFGTPLLDALRLFTELGYKVEDDTEHGFFITENFCQVEAKILVSFIDNAFQMFTLIPTDTSITSEVWIPAISKRYGSPYFAHSNSAFWIIDNTVSVILLGSESPSIVMNANDDNVKEQ